MTDQPGAMEVLFGGSQPTKAGPCRLTVSKPVLKPHKTQRYKLKYDELLSKFAFNF